MFKATLEQSIEETHNRNSGEVNLSRSESVLLLSAFLALAASMISFTTL